MKVFLAICCLVFALPAAAQSDAISDLEILQRLKATSAYGDYWRKYVNMLPSAHHQLKAAAEIKKCDKISEDDSLIFAPAYRAAIDEIAGSYTNPVLADPAARVWTNGATLYAYHQLSDAEKTSLESMYRDQALMKELAAAAVLDEFAESMDIVRVGADLQPAAPIWLKTYFRREGKLAALRKAIAAAKPALLKSFDRVRDIDAHTAADIAWLKDLATELIESEKQIADAYAARIPPPMQARMKAFRAHPFQAWLAKAQDAQGHPLDEAFFPGRLSPDSELSTIKAEIGARYPPPASLIEKLERATPMSLAGKLVERFCPPAQKKS